MDTVEGVLTDLRKLDDVLDAFVTTTGGTVYTAPNNKPKINNPGLLTLIYSTVKTLVSVLSNFRQYDANRIVIELQDVIVFINSVDEATVLVCVTPNLINVGYLEVEMENARRDIKKIIKGQ